MGQGGRQRTGGRDYSEVERCGVGRFQPGELVDWGGGREDTHPSLNPSSSGRAVIGLSRGGSLVGDDPSPYSVPQRLIVPDFTVLPHPHPCAHPSPLLPLPPTLRAFMVPGPHLNLGADGGEGVFLEEGASG